jgi:hypothetical protein
MDTPTTTEGSAPESAESDKAFYAALDEIQRFQAAHPRAAKAIHDDAIWSAIDHIKLEWPSAALAIMDAMTKNERRSADYDDFRAGLARAAQGDF